MTKPQLNPGSRPSFVPKRCTKEECESPEGPPTGCICDKNTSNETVEDVLA